MKPKAPQSCLPSGSAYTASSPYLQLIKVLALGRFAASGYLPPHSLYADAEPASCPFSLLFAGCWFGLLDCWIRSMSAAQAENSDF